MSTRARCISPAHACAHACARRACDAGAWAQAPERRRADGVPVLEVRRGSEQDVDDVARARIARGSERGIALGVARVRRTARSEQPLHRLLVLLDRRLHELRALRRRLGAAAAHRERPLGGGAGATPLAGGVQEELALVLHELKVF